MTTPSAGVEVPVPKPDLEPGDMLARAAGLREQLREEQPATEERGHAGPELVREFLDAGFYRTLQPRRFGGYEFDVESWYRVVMELARGCVSSAWGVALIGGHPMQLASLFPQQTQIECFGLEGDFRAPSRAAATGRATPVDGGWHVEGTWDYCSGAPHSTHFMPVVLLPGNPPTPGYAVVPRDGYEILDDWHGMLGLRGSGSNSIRVDCVVPEGWVIDTNLMAPEWPGDRPPGWEIHGNAMYSGRAAGFFDLELISLSVGLVKAAIDEYEAIIRTKQTFAPPFIPRFHHPEYQRMHGLAMGMVAAAEGAVLSGARQYHEHCARAMDGGDSFTHEDDIRLFTQAQHANRLCWEAMDTLWRTCGSTPTKDGQRMQRYWRDMSIIRGHFSQQFDLLAGALSRLSFGLPQ
jgi:3-hydroxy-9,10-secoandrosta-1,3,5(10)-triene-9,17-dione monooxygenase